MIYSVLKIYTIDPSILGLSSPPLTLLAILLPAQLYSDHSKLLHGCACLSARVVLHSLISAVLNSYCQLFPRSTVISNPPVMP